MLPAVPPASTTLAYPTIPELLPHDKIYTLVVGGVPFQVSGASLSYDSPSCFTDYFLRNPDEQTLVLDRSSKLFEKVAMHLQGYSVRVGDDFDWVHLLSESTYYNLQRLRTRLINEGVMVNISNRVFKIPKEVLMGKSGNHPNLFTLVYDNIMSDPLLTTSVFRRPPPFSPIVTNKDPIIFEQLLSGLHGNSVAVRDESHLADLLRDCKYYQFFELEQRLTPVQLIQNPFTCQEEILISFEHVKKQGLLNDAMSNLNHPFSKVKYARPHVDVDRWRDLVVQFKECNLCVLINPALDFTQLVARGPFALKLASFLREISDDYEFDETKQQITLIANVEQTSACVNGMKMDGDWVGLLRSTMSNNDTSKLVEVKLIKSQWRFNVAGRSKLWMDCVRFEGVLDETHFNETRRFL